MKVAILAPTPVPAAWGGAERAVDGLRRAIETHAGHDVEIVNLAVYERDLVGTITGYSDFSKLDVSRFDHVISVKYPAWMAPHPNHTVLMFHPLRGLYDTYPAHLPTVPMPKSHEMGALFHSIAGQRNRSALDEFFPRFERVARTLGPGHVDLEFPGPIARELVHWLDQIALAPQEIRRHLALSNTVASRPGYFPPDVRPRVLHLPGDLPPVAGPLPPGRHLVTASRLDAPKRIDLLIRSMEAVDVDVPLLIAGDGPEMPRLQRLAARDPRVRLLGFVSDDELIGLYRDAIAVPFVPADEDLGLITLEAFAQGSPVVTTTDAGGPTEFVADGVTGIVAEPHPWSIGWALQRLASDPAWARDMGDIARERARRVTWKRVVDTLYPPTRRSRPTADRPNRSPRPDAIRSPERAARRRPRRRILVASTFGIDDPRHGGQLRARNLYGALTTDADIHLVALASRATPGTRTLQDGFTQTVVRRSPTQSDRDEAIGETIGFDVTDILSGTNAELTPDLDDALRTAAAGVDLVILAEPYLLPAIRRAGIDAPLVYDAYNAEFALKSNALPDTDLGRSLLEIVEDVEGRAVTESALVLTCSADDTDQLARHHGRDRAGFLVVPNGTNVPDRIPTAVEREASRLAWLDHLHRAGGDHRIEHLALFLGSWHPPNIDAARLIADFAGDLPHVQFISGGTHGEAFADRPLPANLAFPGRVTETVRRRLLDTASVALNPMRIGSGTNLKLVEYLASGVPTVTTRFGARGVPVVHGEHLLVAEPADFADAVAATVADPAAAHIRARAGADLASTYDWRELGRRLGEALSRVTDSDASG